MKTTFEVDTMQIFVNHSELGKKVKDFTNALDEYSA
jgi:hypothetical protein